MGMSASQLVVYLNAINVGELDGIQAKLEEARKACKELQQDGLVGALVEAESALQEADMKTYRKRVATVVARLGHIR